MNCFVNMNMMFHDRLFPQSNLNMVSGACSTNTCKVLCRALFSQKSHAEPPDKETANGHNQCPKHSLLSPKSEDRIKLSVLTTSAVSCMKRFNHQGCCNFHMNFSILIWWTTYRRPTECIYSDYPVYDKHLQFLKLFIVYCTWFLHG